MRFAGAEEAVVVPVAADIQDMKLGASPDFVRQGSQLILPEAEDAQINQISNVVGQIIQPVPVDVEVGQFCEGTDRVGENGEVVLGQNQLLEGHTSAEEKQTTFYFEAGKLEAVRNARAFAERDQKVFIYSLLELCNCFSYENFHGFREVLHYFAFSQI